MSHPSAIDTLVGALSALPAYQDPLNAVYDVLDQQPPLTLRAIRTHSQLLRDYAGQVQDQTSTVNRIIASCKRISPTPLPAIPLGF